MYTDIKIMVKLTHNKQVMYASVNKDSNINDYVQHITHSSVHAHVHTHTYIHRCALSSDTSYQLINNTVEPHGDAVIQTVQMALLFDII